MINSLEGDKKLDTEAYCYETIQREFQLKELESAAKWKINFKKVTSSFSKRFWKQLIRNNVKISNNGKKIRFNTRIGMI
jgi:hypothetical protein